MYKQTNSEFEKKIENKTISFKSCLRILLYEIVYRKNHIAMLKHLLNRNLVAR